MLPARLARTLFAPFEMASSFKMVIREFAF
jgi:hypothetical protein